MKIVQVVSEIISNDEKKRLFWKSKNARFFAILNQKPLFKNSTEHTLHTVYVTTGLKFDDATKLKPLENKLQAVFPNCNIIGVIIGRKSIEQAMQMENLPEKMKPSANEEMYVIHVNGIHTLPPQVVAKKFLP